jgi:tetratricopeptide (TPR) repeat protein
MMAPGRLARIVAVGLALCVIAPPGRAADPAVAVAVTTWKGDPRLVFKWRRDVKFEIEERDGEARIRFLAPGTIDAKALAKAKAFAPRIVDDPEGTTVFLKLPPDRQLRPARSGKSIVVDVVRAPPRRKTVPLPAEAPPLPRPRPTPPTRAAAVAPPAALAPAKAPARLAGSVIVRSSWQEHRHYIRFDWPRPVAAAVFRRGGWIWVVFDGALPVNFVEQKKAELIQPVAHPGATVFRIVAPSGFNPTIARTGSAWVVDLQDQALRPEHPVRGEPHPEASPPRVHFALHFAAAAPVDVVDPDLGEHLLVVPNGELGEGIARTASFVDFQVLASAQGLALQPTGQKLAVVSSAAGVEVMGRDGLHLARGADRQPAPPAAKPGRLFDLAAWAAAPGKQLEKRQALVAAASSAPEAMRTARRLDLARFYFAEGLAPEAYGVLRAIERDDPGVFAQPGPRLLLGAAAFLDGDREEAARALGGKSLDGEVEGELWRAALAAAQGSWAAAGPAFGRAGPILASYPTKIRHALVLTAATAAVEAQQAEAARRLLEPLLAEKPSVADRGAALLLVAELHCQQGDLAKAAQIWGELADGPDKLSRVKARLERTLALLEKDQIARPEAIEQLERVHAEWRGDEIEFRTLRALAALKVREGDWRGGFEAFEQLQKNFPDHKEAKAVVQQAADAMAQLFASPALAKIPPVVAFKLFERYGGLVPLGERRDAIATRLAGRLAEVDLLERAASVVEAQLANRPVDGETARLTLRLATFRLGERKPDLALAALDRPVGEVAPAVEAERSYARARSLAQKGRAEDALAVLGDDRAPAADRIRLDIFVGAKRWKEALPAYARLAPEPGAGLDDAAAREVLNWATAATLAGDAGAITAIREGYAAAMEASRDRDAFRLVIGDPRALQPKVSAAQ